jgi:predicted RNA-binding Zn-ribbon protein involved in translation (DUF1610 family)
MNDPNDDNEIEGGETACYAHFICPECGAVSPEHLADCNTPIHESKSPPASHG